MRWRKENGGEEVEEGGKEIESGREGEIGRGDGCTANIL